MCSRFNSWRQFCCALLCLLPMVLGNAAVVVDPSRLTGSWYDPSHDGEGINIDMRSSEEGVVYWYTYDAQGNQVWILGVAQWDGSNLVVEQAFTTTGGEFGPEFDPNSVQAVLWGSFTLAVADCESLVLNYQGPLEFGSGELVMQRLTRNIESPCPPVRKFRLGFTPFPFDATQQAVDFAFSVIAQDGDIIAQHFDDGIPWPEALAGGDFQTYDPAYVAEWQGRKAATPEGHQVFVSITPIDLARQALAPYRGATGDIPLTELDDGWEFEAFDSSRIRSAFLNHAINVVEFFEPDYLAIGIEVNLLAANSPQLWQSYVNLNKETFVALKQRYPKLPVFVTVTGADLLAGWTALDLPSQLAAFEDVIGFSDLFAISFYPFLSEFLTNDLPEDTFESLFALSDKPVAISETGYPAQPLTIEVAPNFIIQFDGTEEKQLAYFQQLFRATKLREVEFIVNFVSHDYDALCVTLGGCTATQVIWRDTGMYDENSQQRPVLELWRSHLNRPLPLPP